MSEGPEPVDINEFVNDLCSDLHLFRRAYFQVNPTQDASIVMERPHNEWLELFDRWLANGLFVNILREPIQ